jgi:hypothetical protein
VNKRTLKQIRDSLGTINERILAAYEVLESVDVFEYAPDEEQLKEAIWAYGSLKPYETTKAAKTALEMLDQAATQANILLRILDEEQDEIVRINEALNLLKQHLEQQ